MRSRWRLELSASARRGRGSAEDGAAPTDDPEAIAYAQEFPGASLRAARAFRELEVVGGMAETVIASLARRYGLSHAALNALAVVEGNGGPMPAGAVGASMHITTGTMTSVLDTLERKGYVVRLIDPDDRRRVLVEITPQAQEVLDALLPEVAQVTTAVLEVIPVEELDQFLVLLDRIREAISAAPTALGPPPPRQTPPSLRRT